MRRNGQNTTRTGPGLVGPFVTIYHGLLSKVRGGARPARPASVTRQVNMSTKKLRARSFRPARSLAAPVVGRYRLLLMVHRWTF